MTAERHDYNSPMDSTDTDPTTIDFDPDALRDKYRAERDKRLVVKADVSSQIRVRPSPALVAEVEQVVGQGAVSFR